MVKDDNKKFEENLNYQIDKSNLSVDERFDSNGRISVVRASDGRYYVYQEKENLFEYPSDDKNAVFKMFNDVIAE